MSKMIDSNAKKALKQLRMEIAADYGMGHDDVFDIIENAHSQGSLAGHFKKLEEKRSLHGNIYSSSNKKM